MLLITGASGQLGKAVIQSLLAKNVPAAEIAGLVRDPQKAPDLNDQGVQLLTGDYEDYDSLVKAFSRAERVLFISTTEVGEPRNRQHGNVVRAAQAAGVKHLYYTSILNPAPDAIFAATPGHYLTEKLISDSGIPATIFRNALYLDLVPLLIGNAAESGEIYFAATDQKVAFVLRSDLAEAIAAEIVTNGHKGKTLNLSSGQTYSFRDIADALGQAAGKTVKYIPISTDDLRHTLNQYQVPAPIVTVTTNLAEAIQASEFDLADATTEELLGRPPVSLAQFLKKVTAS